MNPTVLIQKDKIKLERGGQKILQTISERSAFLQTKLSVIEKFLIE